MIRLANERGGEDNITVVVARFVGEGLPPAPEDEELTTVRIERDDRLPDAIEPDVWNDPSLSLPLHFFTEQDERTREQSEGDDPSPAADDPVPGIERMEREEPSPADRNQTRGLSLALLIILFLLLVGAVVSTLWYLKVRGGLRAEPSDEPTLAFDGLATHS